MPKVSYGTKYHHEDKGKSYSIGHDENGFEEPLFAFVPSIGISALNICPSKLLNYYKKNCLIGLSLYGNDLRPGKSLLIFLLDKNFEKIHSIEKILLEKPLRHFMTNDKNEIFERGDFLATGTVYAAKILKKYCYYNEGIKNSGLENYELILRLIQDQKIGKHIANSMFCYRRHNSNISIKKNQQIINNGGVLFEKLGLGTYRTNKFHPYNPQEA